MKRFIFLSLAAALVISSCSDELKIDTGKVKAIRGTFYSLDVPSEQSTFSVPIIYSAPYDVLIESQSSWISSTNTKSSTATHWFSAQSNPTHKPRIGFIYFKGNKESLRDTVRVCQDMHRYAVTVSYSGAVSSIPEIDGNKGNVEINKTEGACTVVSNESYASTVKIKDLTGVSVIDLTEF